MKNVYLDVSGWLHSLYKHLILHPPPGYQFTTEKLSWDRATSRAFNIAPVFFFEQKILGKIMPVKLIKNYLERWKKIPQGTDLTYSAGHLVFRKEPWVVDFEFVSQLTSYSLWYFRRFRKLIERSLSSEYCKRIICWTEASKKTVLWNMDCTGFEHKVEVVPLAVPPKEFKKSYSRDKVRLLFVTSANILGQFELYGGKEVVEAFLILKEKYDNLELVLRSDMPRGLKRRYSQIPNLRIIDKIIPWESLEQEFMSSDIFVFPAHSSSALVTLDAMSYELPVVTTDVWSNPEMVEDSITGFVVPKAEKVPYYTGNFILNCRLPQYLSRHDVDAKVVQELARKTSILIEDEELRRRMGAAGRWQIEHGKFSLEKRNERLKRIFDEATEDKEYAPSH